MIMIVMIKFRQVCYTNDQFYLPRDLAERNYHHIDMEQQCLLKLAEKEAKMHPFNIRKCKNYYDVKLKAEGMFDQKFFGSLSVSLKVHAFLVL